MRIRGAEENEIQISIDFHWSDRRTEETRAFPAASKRIEFVESSEWHYVSLILIMFREFLFSSHFLVDKMEGPSTSGRKSHCLLLAFFIRRLER